MNNLDFLNGLTETTNNFNQKIEAIEKRLFNVVKVPLVTQNLIDVNGMLQPSNFDNPIDTFGMYKQQGGECLGIVGKDFTPVQPLAFFDMFVEALLQTDLQTEKIQLKLSKGDRKMRFRLPLKSFEVNNGSMKNDITDVFLNFETGFDGKTATSMFLETVRLVCTNGMRKSFTEQKTKFRNTTNNEGKAVSLLADIAQQLKNADDLKTIYEKMARKEFNEALRNEYLSKVTGYNIADYSNLSTRSQNIIDMIQNDIERELKDSNASILALFNGITRYNQHTAKGSENEDFIFYDKGMKMNNKALEVALQLS